VKAFEATALRVAAMASARLASLAVQLHPFSTTLKQASYPAMVGSRGTSGRRSSLKSNASSPTESNRSAGALCSHVIAPFLMPRQTRRRGKREFRIRSRSAVAGTGGEALPQVSFPVAELLG